MKILSELPLEGPAMHSVGGKDLCALFDISAAALTDLKQRGIAVQLGHNSYDLTRSVTNYVTHLRGVAAQWGTGEQATNLTAERARLAKEQADAQALKNAKLRGDLVDAGDVERAWSDVLRQVRARLLAVPSRLRADLPGAHPETFAAMDRALRDALTELGHADD